jgi:hypothetical protein
LRIHFAILRPGMFCFRSSGEPFVVRLRGASKVKSPHPKTTMAIANQLLT